MDAISSPLSAYGSSKAQKVGTSHEIELIGGGFELPLLREILMSSHSMALE